MAASTGAPPAVSCQICGYRADAADPADLGTARGNTERFRATTFHLWKCPRCETIHNIDPVDFGDIYADYPLRRRQLDVFARGTMRNLLGRLEREGLKKTDSILDYGCGNGVFLRFLQEEGYADAAGYDPYEPEYAAVPTGRAPFDCVIANDVIEHCPDARAMVRHCAELLEPGGLLYIGTADSEGVDMHDLEPQLMRLHQPFHRLIFTQKSLERLGTEGGLELVRSYRRSYMDTRKPFANYRFLDEFSKALGHNMDRSFDPSAGRVILRRPTLLFWAFFGYFFPSAYEPAVILRKPALGKDER
jgi:2-polyprenyl-3-methyl-5-hydroxy-6-metoxy-1,4-benzoquinol methylase